MNFTVLDKCPTNESACLHSCQKIFDISAYIFYQLMNVNGVSNRKSSYQFFFLDCTGLDLLKLLLSLLLLQALQLFLRTNAIML